MSQIKLINGDTILIRKEPVKNDITIRLFDVKDLPKEDINTSTQSEKLIYSITGEQNGYLYLTGLWCKISDTTILDKETNKIKVSWLYNSVKPVSTKRIPVSSVLYIEEDI